MHKQKWFLMPDELPEKAINQLNQYQMWVYYEHGN